MVDISALPVELLSRIFGYIDSNVQLAQCRLVCSKWNHPANTTMLSNKIVLRTKEKALALHGQLFINSSNGRFIRHIHFEETFDAFWLVKALFDTASIPNVERFSGVVATADFYTWILDFTKDTPSAFPKLRQLPEYNKVPDQAYCDALLKFRSTITTIDIGRNWDHMNDTTRNFIQQLDTFEKLTTLKYNGSFQQLSEVELLLKGCNRLKTLELAIFLDGQSMDKAALDAWLAQNVTQVKSLKKLTIRGDGGCNIAEYLTQKYPCISDITLYLNQFTTLHTNNIVNFKNNMDRLFLAIDNIPKKKFGLWIPHNSNFYEIVSYFLDQQKDFCIKRKEQERKLLYIDIGRL